MALYMLALLFRLHGERRPGGAATAPRAPRLAKTGIAPTIAGATGARVMRRRTRLVVTASPRHRRRLPIELPRGELAEAAVLPGVERPALDPLPERQGLAQADDVERDGASQVQHQLGRRDAVVGRPVALAVRVPHVRRGEAGVAAAHVAGRGLARRGQVEGERLLEEPPEAAERTARRSRGCGRAGRAAR